MKWSDNAIILGTGQLAWMLQTQGRQMGLKIEAVDQLPSTSEFHTLTFESEFYKPSEIENHTQNAEIFPSLKCLGLLQDRLSQKQSLSEHKLETSPFLHSEDLDEIRAFFLKNKALVAKKRFGGYDGYGTFLLRNKQQFEQFITEHPDDLSHFIFERLITFSKEMALQVARSRSGDVQFFPLVETIQKDNKCFLVLGPRKCPPQLQKKIKSWLGKISYVGVMGIEFFQTTKGLLINEIAPRVHNTGHHTLDSCSVDQFTMHWLCALQDRLPEVTVKTQAFAMLNLIGKSHEPVVFPKALDGHLYWYKKTNRPGRKLGHVNFTGQNEKALQRRALQHLKSWKF